jgi:hypothetical protein
MYLLDENDLPVGMSYPDSLRRLIGRGITYLEPWFILDSKQARDKLRGLTGRYPGRNLFPFARREDNDDVACFERELPGKVVIVHDFASNGWENRDILEDFHSWVRRAVDDMIEFDIGEDSE